MEEDTPTSADMQLYADYVLWTVEQDIARDWAHACAAIPHPERMTLVKGDDPDAQIHCDER